MPIEPWLRRAAALAPDQVAVSAPAGALTYSELARSASRVAGGLAADGVAPGDRIGLPARPGPEFAVALHGVLLAGAVAVPLDPRLAPREVEARRAGTRMVLDGLPDGEPVEGAGSWAEDAPALVVHTSGTTGSPKEVVLTHGNLLHNALGSAAALGLDPDEVWLSPLPLAHVGGLMVLVRSAVYATQAVLLPPPFDATAAARLLAERATVASLVPTMLRRVLDAGLTAPARLRAVLLGGAPADAALLRRAADAGVPVAQTYGLTEACSQVTVARPGDAESVGRPLPGVAVTLAADGEILVEGPTVAGGGVLATGDLGRLDGAGRLVVTGRRDDLIVTGGENVMPAEIEAVLLEHPAVADAGVFGRPDPEWGRAVVARVVLREGGAPPGEEELRAFCAERLARFKVPKAVEAVARLPRTPSGKLRRDALAAPGATGS